MVSKFIKSLLLLSFVFAAVIDVAYYDAMDLQHHHLEDNHEAIDNHEKFSSHVDVEAHCGSHTLHHCLTASGMIQQYSEMSAKVIFSNIDDLTTDQSIQPATPPPLNLLT